MHPTCAPIKDVVTRLLCIMLPAGAVLTLTYALPTVDLTGPLAHAAYWVSESGGRYGIPFVGFAMLVMIVGRSGLSLKERAGELLAMSFGLGIFLVGGALLNEHVVKPLFAVPRPNIDQLATKRSPAPVLQMSAEEFYALPDKAVRSEHLRKVLTPDAWPLDERVRNHWIAETGYSFPSGHSFAAMMCATFFLALGLRCFSGRQLWAFYALVLWAMAVCVSRPILRVHSPTDICVGSLEGIVAGVLAFLLVERLLLWMNPPLAA